LNHLLLAIAVFVCQVHCYIAICMQRHHEVPEWEEVAAVACAAQNMQLVATALGVAGYWSSWCEKQLADSSVTNAS